MKPPPSFGVSPRWLCRGRGSLLGQPCAVPPHSPAHPPSPESQSRPKHPASPSAQPASFRTSCGAVPTARVSGSQPIGQTGGPASPSLPACPFNKSQCVCVAGRRPGLLLVLQEVSRWAGSDCPPVKRVLLLLREGTAMLAAAHALTQLVRAAAHSRDAVLIEDLTVAAHSAHTFTRAPTWSQCTYNLPLATPPNARACTRAHR